jgi:hypothetical protein
MHYYRVHGAAGLVLHAVNGQLCAGRQYAEQIDLIRDSEASDRPLTISFRQPRANETYAVPKQVGEGVASKTEDQTKKVQRPVPQKKSAHAATSPPLPSSVKSSTPDFPSAFKQPRASVQVPEEGVPPVRQKGDFWQTTFVPACISGCWLTNLGHNLRVAEYSGTASRTRLFVPNAA